MLRLVRLQEADAPYDAAAVYEASRKRETRQRVQGLGDE
jgi:hypothetical protein